MRKASPTVRDRSSIAPAGWVQPAKPFSRGLLLGLLALSLACGDPTGPAEQDSIEAWMEFHGVPAVAVAVIRNYEVAYVERYGVVSTGSRDPIDENTRFQAASMSKGVSAAMVMTLVQDGVVTLDEDIDDYLTSWELPWTIARGTEPVTLRRLLSHTAGTTVSGFRGYRSNEPLPSLLEVLAGTPPANSPPIVVDTPPGTGFRYSGGGYEVMEQAIRDVTGESFPDLVRDRILEPMGMTMSTLEQPAPDSLAPFLPTGHYANGTRVPGGHHTYREIAAGGLWATPEDVARFLTELQRTLNGEGSGVLSQASAETLLTEVMRDYGLGFDLLTRAGERYFGHQGANDGFRGGMIAHVSSGDGAVILTNSDRGSELYEDLVPILGRREGWPGYGG